MLLGNCDGHLKNYALLRNSDWSSVKLAPVYDISSTVVYSGLDRHFAFRIGSTNKIDDITADDFTLLAREIRFSRKAMSALIDEVCQLAAEGFAMIDLSAISDCETAQTKLEEIRGYALSQANKLGSRR